jgi:hypothetical protein
LKRILIIDDEADVTITFKAGIEESNNNNNDANKSVPVYLEWEKAPHPLGTTTAA